MVKLQSQPYDNSMEDIIQHLLAFYNKNEAAIEAWFAARYKEAQPHFYTSVDLRHSGYKIVPVDTNLFPAGFNNLSQASIERSVEVVKQYLKNHLPGAKKILIIPENHTRNLNYLENLAALRSIFEQASLEVQFGSLIATPRMPLALESPSGQKIIEQPLQRMGSILQTENGFKPDLIVVNNDFTSGAPEILCSLAQPIVPPPGLGWYRRLKSVHFHAYDQLVYKFTQAFPIDPWLLSTHFERCGLINFQESTGIECVALNVEKVLHAVRAKYQEYGIKNEPYVFVKADSGTYGMGIMTVRSAEELLSLNKKARNKMKVIKEGTPNMEVIIQEGVPTVDMIEGKPSEPMIYLINGTPVGGAFRVNAERDATSNLNAAGMSFTGMCDEAEGNSEKIKVKNCNYKVYGLISRLAAYAAATENYEPAYSI